MIWTSSKPTTPGYYWWMEFKDARIHHVFTNERWGGLYLNFYGEPRKLDGLSGWWAGPIPEPEMPPKPDDVVERPLYGNFGGYEPNGMAGANEWYEENKHRFR